MAAGTEFEKGLMETLRRLEAEYQQADARAQLAIEEREAKSRERTIVLEALEIHRRLFGGEQLIDEALRRQLAGKTVREMIIELARENDPPKFRVVDMNKKLVKAGMFVDVQKAAEGVYSCLGRNPKSFAKINKGLYVVTENGRIPIERSKSKRPGATGLRDRVASIRAEHPEWKREDVVTELQRLGWDFGSTNPIFAVGACFASLAR